LAKLRLEIWKLCVVKIYTDIDEVVVVIKIEEILGKLKEILYEPMKEEQDERYLENLLQTNSCLF
jgi:hypothetical protein